MGVLILASGMGLGHYIPALLLRDELRRKGRHAEVRVFESELDDTTHAKIARTTAAYQSDFGKALVGQRLHGMFGAASQALDAQALDRQALDTQALEPQEFDAAEHIVVFAGYWCPYLLAVPASKIDLIHVDLSPSPSWSAAADQVRLLKQNGARELWLSRKESTGRRLVLSEGHAPLSWAGRERRVLVHGGGWAIGHLEAAIQQLCHISVDVLLGSRPRLLGVAGDVRQFGSPANWQPWSAPADLPFPPLLQRTIDGDILIESGTRHHALDLLGKYIAVVSKPGGMALAESLMTATPLVFLTPFGPHERSNAVKWIDEGFAIWFDDWKMRNFVEAPLEALHANLVLARKNFLRYDCDRLDDRGRA